MCARKILNGFATCCKLPGLDEACMLALEERGIASKCPNENFGGETCTHYAGTTLIGVAVQPYGARTMQPRGLTECDLGFHSQFHRTRDTSHTSKPLRRHPRTFASTESKHRANLNAAALCGRNSWHLLVVTLYALVRSFARLQLAMTSCVELSLLYNYTQAQ